MIIRAEQIQILAAATYDRFCRIMADRVRTIWSEPFKGQSDEELRQCVAGWITRGKNYGLRSEHALVCYIDSTCAMGNGFEERENCRWAREILTDARMSPELKAIRLWARVRQEAK